MRYLLLCCHEEKKLDSMSKSQCDAIMEETVAYCEALKKSGHLIGVEALESIQTAMAGTLISRQIWNLFFSSCR